MLNCVNYLLDDTGLINIRARSGLAFIRQRKGFCKLWQDTSHNYRAATSNLSLIWRGIYVPKKRKYGQ
jgi:hypothetical protein